jgi:hypothetical protein
MEPACLLIPNFHPREISFGADNNSERFFCHRNFIKPEEIYLRWSPADLNLQQLAAGQLNRCSFAN